MHTQQHYTPLHAAADHGSRVHLYRTSDTSNPPLVSELAVRTGKADFSEACRKDPRMQGASSPTPKP